MKRFYRGPHETTRHIPERPPAQADAPSGDRQRHVHNRGCAVDLGLYDLKTGEAVEMPSGYDEMTERAFVTYQGGTAEQRAHRDLLRKAMEREGRFFVYPEEWWHYDYKDYREYAVQNIPFSDIRPGAKQKKPISDPALRSLRKSGAAAR